MNPAETNANRQNPAANVARYGTVFILIHGVVSLLHEISHRILPVTLPLLKYAIAYAFVAILPLVAMVMLWTRRRRYGVWLLLVSMAGSMLYAGYHHFILINPDHIFHATPGAWLPVFQVTAVLMLILEGFGCWYSFWLLGRLGRASTPA